MEFVTDCIVDSSSDMLQMRYFYISVPLIAGNLGPLTGTRVIIGTAAARAALHIYISVCSIYLCPNSGIWLSASAWIFFFFFFLSWAPVLMHAIAYGHNGARRLTGLRDGSQGCNNAEIRFTGL